MNDPELLTVLSTFSTPEKRIYLMTHFDHPRELTTSAIRAIDALLRNGVICANQCPLIRGVNDDSNVLATLFRRLSWIGCPPYYLFQGRPTAGNAPYRVPLVEAWEIFRATVRQGSGLAQRARFVMSHHTGKIEVVGVDEQRIYMLSPPSGSRTGQVLVYLRNVTRTGWTNSRRSAIMGRSPRATGPAGDAGDAAWRRAATGLLVCAAAELAGQHASSYQRRRYL